MNVLSLRINAFKTEDSIKKCKQELLQLEIEDFWSEEIKQLIKAINDATTTENQLRELKKLARLIVNGNYTKVNRQIISKLIAIYFEEKVKHPAKSTIQSSLNQSTEQDLIVEIIEYEIQQRIESINLNSSDACYHFISCLNEASQNFRPAIKAVGQQVDIIVGLINKFIKAYDGQLKTSLSPAQKNEVSHQLHCCLQAAIFCVKNFINDTNNSVAVKKNLECITVDCVDLIDNEDLPMDVKNNCAMLIVLHSVLTGKNDHIDWIRDEKCSVERRLSLVFGVISTLSSTNVDFELLVDISRILKEIFLESPVDPALLQSVCRSFMQMTKKIANMEIQENSEHLESIFMTTLSVAFMNIDHHMDSTRFMMKETIKNLAETSAKLIGDDILTDRIFLEIHKLANVNLKSVVILAIIASISADQILHQLPSFHDIILHAVSESKIANPNLINCYEALANSSYRENEYRWFKHFVEKALNYLKSETQPEVRLMLENLIIRFIKKDKKVLDMILEHQKDHDIGFILLCLSTGKRMGIFEQEPSTQKLWKGIIDFSEIKTAMVNADDNVRASALMLIVEARKTVTGFTQEEIDCIIYFLKYNINVQSPSSRQTILGLVKTMFVRLQSALQWIHKKKDQASIDFYFEFLVRLQEFCLQNLFEGANFSRRMLSLRILFFTVDAVNEHFKQKSSIIWSKTKFAAVLNVLNDSFEANKEMAIEIMKRVPKEVVKVYSSIDLKALEVMMKSIKPQDSLTSSYLMEILALITLNVGDFTFDPETTSQEVLCMLIWCEKNLLEGLVTAEKSLIVAASTNPLYGFVLSIRHLLSKLDFKLLGKSQDWRDFFERLINICIRLTQVVSPVVNSSSPEGILPEFRIEEFEDLDEDTRENWKKISDQVTPQIILLCSWRTIKEVSLLLGNICLKAPLMNENVGLVSVEQILNIGDHFLELLSKTKHRGAFEQCFFGFSQFCLRLWTCDEPELHKLPTTMLQQMIHSISGVEKEETELLSLKNLCATRRSAGLPFMIQALITSELNVSSNKNFHYVMKNLIQFCQHGKHLETRTHSLNILRALFRCTDLNEAIGEYIADGIKCAIIGYGAESWLERNSSTLLFSSLVIRIFGVQRTKDGDELSMRNKMSCRLFFLRYPGLYDFFMEHLLEASEYVSNVQMNPKLHPLLLLLLRLFPSSTEGSESKLELTGFTPVVSRCTGCVEMQTRILCAKFIASVLSPEQSFSRINQLISVLKEYRNCCPANISHGILLQILHIVKALPSTSQRSHEDELMDLLKGLPLIRDQFRSFPVCYGTFLDIIIGILEKIWHKHEAFGNIILECLEKFNDFDDSESFGLTFVTKKFFLLKLVKFLLNENSQLIDDTDSKKVFADVFQSALNTFLLMGDFDYALSMKDEYDIDPKEIFFFESLPQKRRDHLSQQLRQDEEKKNMFALLTRSHDARVTVKAFDILSLMVYDKEEMKIDVIQNLIRMAMSKPEQLKKSMLKFANICVEGGNLYSQLDFKFLVELSTDSSFHVKSSVIDFISSIAKVYKSITSLDTILYFSKSVLLLLMDDEDEIRRRCTETVMNKLVLADRSDVLPSYAQEQFIEFLLQTKNFVHFSKHELMALVSLIVVDVENSLIDIVDYRVFDKNEVNLFGETYIVQKQCIDSLWRTLQENGSSDDIEQIVVACQKFTDYGKADIKKFLFNLQKDNI